MKENYYVLTKNANEFFKQVKYMRKEMLNDPQSPYRNTPKDLINGKAIAAVIIQVLIMFLDQIDIPEGEEFRLDIKNRNSKIPYMFISGKYGEFDDLRIGIGRPVAQSFGYNEETLEITTQEVQFLIPGLKLLYEETKQKKMTA